MSNFTVGDWVRHIDDNSVFKVIVVHDLGDELFYSDGYKTHRIIKLEQWQPKEGEWCWFWDDGFNPILLKFKECFNTKCIGVNVMKRYSQQFEHCEPFIGELPSFLKENK